MVLVPVCSIVLVFKLPSASSRWRHSVFGLSERERVRACVRGRMLKVCEHDITSTTSGSFTTSATLDAVRDEDKPVRFGG